MRVLVAYATKHGATPDIADRIAGTLTGAGHEVTLCPVAEADDADRYDAVVLGSAVYLGHWRKEALTYARRQWENLGTRPVWLFSSGPLGTQLVDEEGRDLRDAADPEELPELLDVLHPQGHHVFFGELDPKRLTVAERALRRLPAGRKLLPEGDFRDWDDVDRWAERIAARLRDGPPSP